MHGSCSIFKSADAAYVLAFSVIMLTTDLHSDQVSAVAAETRCVLFRVQQVGIRAVLCDCRSKPIAR